MKISVILGVLQMSLGVCMKGFNALYFKSYVDFFFEFIPQIALLLALFGWMDTLIVAKWIFNVDIDAIEALSPLATDPGALPLSGSPSVITTMINIFLKTATTDTDVSYELMRGQRTISLICLLIAFVSVPIMLCVKPCW
jgi:V-type H+-transporting ATPase subunit a